MSGGRWNSLPYRIYGFIEDIDHLIKTNNNQALDEWGHTEGANYIPEVINELQKAHQLAERLYHMIHCIDFLVCDDYGEETFLEELSERMAIVDKKFEK